MSMHLTDNRQVIIEMLAKCGKIKIHQMFVNKNRCHLAKICKIYKKQAVYLIKEMAKKQGVTEELKATDMMRWIELMNNIRACADEIVLNDIVYS